MTDAATILVVDDHPLNAKLLADVLRTQGYRPLIAFDGTQALRMAADESPAMVLLDVVMPDIDGFEVCRRLRADPRFALLPIVMVTALDPGTERVRALDAGADDFLSKPINSAEVLARVRASLRIKALHDTTARQAAELADWARRLEERVQEKIGEIGRLSRLKRFFSSHLADAIVTGGLDGMDDLLAAHRRKITVVFADLRGFTSFTELAEPEDVMAILREFHAAMGRCIVAHEGTLERFTGDGMMVFFNDPLPHADPAMAACEMAMAMQDAAGDLALSWRRRGTAPGLGLGIGIAEGFATLGAIGFDGRVDYAAIGSVTNLASRLCDEAKPGEILLAPAVATAVEGRIPARELVGRTLPGFVRAVTPYRLSPLPPLLDLLAR